MRDLFRFILERLFTTPLMIFGVTRSVASETSDRKPISGSLIRPDPATNHVVALVCFRLAAITLARLLPVSTVLVAARLAGAAAGFAVQLLLARLFTTDNLGLFFSMTSMAAIASLIAACGYPSIAARYLTRYEQRGQPALLRSFIGQASGETLRMATYATVLISLTSVLYPNLHPETRYALVAAALSIPAMTALAVYGAMADAIRLFMVSLLPDSLFRPLFFLLIVAGCILTELALSVWAAVLILTLLTMALAAYQFRVVSRRLPASAPVTSRRLGAYWRGEAWPLVLVMLFTSLFADLGIMIETIFLRPADLAVFGICLKISLIVGFVVQVAHQVVLPNLAEAYARRDLTRVPDLLLRASWTPIGICSAATLGSAIWGDRVLALVGPEFAHAKGALTLLMGCQLLRAMAGPSSQLLTLQGAQKLNAAVCGASCLVLLAASAIFAPALGLIGAVAAICVTLGFWLMATGLLLYRHKGIGTDVLGLLLSTARR